MIVDFEHLLRFMRLEYRWRPVAESGWCAEIKGDTRQHAGVLALRLVGKCNAKPFHEYAPGTLMCVGVAVYIGHCQLFFKETQDAPSSRQH